MAVGNGTKGSDGEDEDQEDTQSEDLKDDGESCPSLPSAANTFLNMVDSLEDYSTTVPDNLTANILAHAGMDTSDSRMVTLVSLAAQKFMSDIASDALTHCKMRQASSNHMKKGSKEKKYVMTTDDLAVALQEKGVSVKKPPYH